MTVRLIEGQVPYTGGTAIEITADKVINLLLRAENNLLHVNDDNELYCDLQLENGIAVDDDLPVGVTTGIVNESDGRPQNGLLLHYETTSGAYAQRLYGGDGKLYFNGGTGERKLVYYAEDIDELLNQLYNQLIEELTVHAGEGISIQTVDDYSAMRGPCPEGYHVPTYSNILSISHIFGNLGISGSTGVGYLSVPKSGYYWKSGGKEHVNDWAYVWTCKNGGAGAGDRSWVWNGQDGVPVSSVRTSMGIPVRPFKNIPIIPNNQWNVIYDGSSIANGAGIFHSPELGVFSLSGNGQDWITIADKNIGATTIYHTGDQISADNCGYYYQWGNNHGFSYNGGFSTSNTQVDVSSYSPSSYSNNVFITGNDSWMIEINKNLWGGETGVQQITNTIINTGVLSVNGRKGHVIVADNVKAFRLENNQDLDTAQEIFDWFDQGKYPIIHYDNNSYIFRDAQQGALTFICSVPELGEDVYQDNSIIKYKAIELFYTGHSVTNISFLSWTPGINYLDTDVDYRFPYVPQYDGSPATKKYVDDHDVHIGTTAPTDNLVEGRLWYDTTNDVLMSYDGTNWNIVGDDAGNINTKTFYLQDTQDTSTAQDILDWYLAGKNPIVFIASGPYTAESKGAYIVDKYRSDAIAGCLWLDSVERIKYNNNNTGTTGTYSTYIRINYTNSTVTTIEQNTMYLTEQFLATSVNYTHPYTPQYNGSPTTKLYVDQYGPCVPVYHLGGGNVMTSYINFDMAGGTYKIKIQGYHGTTINRTITVTASSTVQGTFTSNLMEHYNYGCIVTIDPSVSTTMIIQIDSNSNFSVDDIYIEKINIQSGIVTATSIN